MLRGFRHTLFRLLQVGVVASGLIAWAVQPQSWIAILICVGGALFAAWLCERIARRYLRYTFGRLRRAAEDVSRGRPATDVVAHPGEDFYKLVAAVNEVGARLARASREEKRLHVELRERERLAFLGELAASVAHEINNPLDGVQSCVRILRRPGADPQRHAQMLDLIESGLARMNLIVRRLLTLAREHVVRPTVTRITPILERAIAAERSRIEERGIDVRVAPPTVNDEAAVDAQLLEQVFVNLIHNAVDSMPCGGAIEVALRRGPAPSPGAAGGTPDPADWLCIDVADTGTGIDPAVRPHIFEPFYTTKTGGKGTGLGLPIAARIVDAHHGAIEVQPRPGGGTVFTVRLPQPAGAPAADAGGVGPKAAALVGAAEGAA